MGIYNEECLMDGEMNERAESRCRGRSTCRAQQDIDDRRVFRLEASDSMLLSPHQLEESYARRGVDMSCGEEWPYQPQIVAAQLEPPSLGDENLYETIQLTVIFTHEENSIHNTVYPSN
jgi:hypothetical protein